MTTIGQLLLSRAQEAPDAVLFRHSTGFDVSYAKACAHAAATLEALDKLGVKRGDRVITYVDDILPSALFHFACAMGGILLVPLSPVFSTTFLRTLAGRVGATFVLTNGETAKVVETLGLSVLRTPGIGPGGSSGAAMPDISEVREAGVLPELVKRAATSHPDDAFVIQPKAGPGGVPSLVVRNHANILRYAERLAQEVAELAEPGPSFLAVAALTNSLGLNVIATAISLGGRLDVPTRIDAGASLLEVRGLDSNVLPMAPRVLRSFYQQHLRQVADDPDRTLFGPGARAVVVAGAPTDLELLRYVSSEGLAVIEAYGLAETSLVALTPRGGWREGRAGRVIEDLEVKCSEDGEIVVRTPDRLGGYLNDEAATRERHTTDGFFKTGDMGEISSDGYLRLVGRKRDVFGTPEGSDLYPEALERAIEGLSGVRQAILIGDRRPYLAAFIAVAEKVKSSEADGFLDETKFAALYERFGKSLADLNHKTERIERISCFALFGPPFAPEIYAATPTGETKRNRKAFAVAYASRIDRLYSPLLPFKNNRMLVPPGERRFSPRGRP